MPPDICFRYFPVPVFYLLPYIFQILFPYKKNIMVFLVYLLKVTNEVSYVSSDTGLAPKPCVNSDPHEPIIPINLILKPQIMLND